MSVARVTELSGTSQNSFNDAVKQVIDRANSTLRSVQSAWIKDMNVMVENGSITDYKVNLEVTFILD